MTFSLMVYLLVVSILLAAGASLMQSLLRASVPGTRFIWATAMGASLVLLAAAPARLRAPAAAPVAIDAVPVTGVAVPIDLPMSLAERTAGAMPMWLPRALGVLWAGASAVVMALLALSYRRHRRRIAGATREVLDGTAVRVTESLGPAVVGVWRPDIVVPRWLLSRAPLEQSLVVRHERSHVEVGDPALLLAGCAAAALMPWNPAAWYMLGRLRLAIEVDCDRRVLRTGAAPREYGALLIELTSALPTARVGAPAFACRPSHLERRLVAMTARPLSNRPARMLAAAGVATIALLGACEADLPTAAEVEQMDAAYVEERVVPALDLKAGDIVYLLDGVVVDRSVVMALPAERIANLEVYRRAGDKPRVQVTTVEGPKAAGSLPIDASTRERRVVAEHAKRPFVIRSSMDGSISAEMGDSGVLSLPTKAMPLLVIDDVLVEESELRKLDMARIEEVEITKGAAAQVRYGAKGVHGVVEVRTKQPLLRKDLEVPAKTVKVP